MNTLVIKWTMYIYYEYILWIKAQHKSQNRLWVHISMLMTSDKTTQLT